MKKRLITIATAALFIAFSAGDVIALAENYPLSITAEAKADYAEIKISGVIHQWENSASQFKSAIIALIAKGIKNVRLYINTPGGSVFEANEIANEIQKFEGTISGYGGALVASAGSYLALICETFEMAENGQYMYHKPMGAIQGNEDSIEASLQLLKNLTNQYRTAYATKTGLSEDDIESRWSKGDVWLTASAAKEQGFITAVGSNKEKVTEKQRALFVACGAPTIPIQDNTNTNMKNRNQIIAALNLASDATDEQIEAAVVKAQDAFAKQEENKQAYQDAAQIKADALIDAAITAKKIDASQKKAWVDNAVANYDGTKAIVDGMPALTKPAPQSQPHASAGGNAAHKDWSLSDYLEKDVKALQELEKTDPEKFIALNNAHYGIDLK